MIKKTKDLINFMVSKVVEHEDGSVHIRLADMCNTKLGLLILIENFGIDVNKIENVSLQQYRRPKEKKSLLGSDGCKICGKPVKNGNTFCLKHIIEILQEPTK